MQDTDDQVAVDAVDGHLLQVLHRVHLDHALIVNDVGGHQDEANRGSEPGYLVYDDGPAILIRLVKLIHVRTIDYGFGDYDGDRRSNIVDEE